MKAENLRNPKISLHVPIAAPKLELWALNITGRIYLIAAVQGVPEKTLVSVQRPITQVWKQLLGHEGAVFKSSGYQLSFETKKSRIM